MLRYITFSINPLRRLLACLLLALGLFGTACTTDDDSAGPGPAPVVDPLETTTDVSTTVSGIVLDEEGEPLSGVTITVHGQTATSTADGSFTLQNIDVPGNRCVIKAEKSGYFTGTRAEIPRKEGTTTVRLRLMSSAITHTLEASTGGTATLDNGSKVEIPANGVVTASGSAYTGEVNMSVRYQDPTSINFGALVAGGDMLARRTDQSTSILYSYGILRVVLSGSSGEKLQLAPGKTSTLTMAIPQSQLATAPATIPLWYFDEEKGMWIEEGSATRQGDIYVGTVKHFTDWNCDDPEEYAIVKGRVVDCSGGFILSGEVFVGQSTSDLSNGVVIDNMQDPNGGTTAGFEMRVPAGMPLMVVVPPPLILVLQANVGTNWVMVPVPPLAPGQVYDVGDIKPHPCPSEATGSFKLKSGDKVSDLSIQVKDPGSNTNLYKGASTVPVKGTSFSVNFLAANATYTMRVATQSGLVVTKEFQTKGAGEETDLGVIDLTSAQLIQVEGVVLCENTPISNADVNIVWQGGSVSTTTDGLGLYQVNLPVATRVNVTATHNRGTASITFETPAEGDFRANNINICHNETQTGENSFVINGGGYTNARQFIQMAPFPSSFGFFNREDNYSELILNDDLSRLGVTLIFEGKATGEVPNTEIKGAVIWIETSSGPMNYWAGFGLEGTSVNINVSKYGEVDKLIEGTYSGTFRDDNGSLVTISQGKFSVIRYYDFSGEECNGFCM